jgi:hypothetical protein
MHIVMIDLSLNATKALRNIVPSEMKSTSIQEAVVPKTIEAPTNSEGSICRYSHRILLNLRKTSAQKRDEPEEKGPSRKKTRLSYTKMIHLQKRID